MSLIQHQGNPMAQIARTKKHQPVEAAKPSPGRVIGTARAAAENGTETTLRLTGKMPATTRDPTGSSAATARRVLGLPARVTSEMAQASGALARFWLEQVNEQVASNARTLNELAAAHGWRERLAIRSAFVGDSLSRLGEGVSRYVDLTGTMVTRLHGTGTAVSAATANPEQHR
jgi:hypothetical protein